MLDEPLASLDAGLRERLLPELRRIFVETGQTVITVTHDQQEASAIADRIAIMNAGRIEQYDRPQALYARPRNAFVAEFLGLGSPVGGEWLTTVAEETFEGEQFLVHPAGMRLSNAAGDDAIELEGILKRRNHEGENWRLTVRVGGEIFRFRHPLEAGARPRAGYEGMAAHGARLGIAAGVTIPGGLIDAAAGQGYAAWLFVEQEGQVRQWTESS